MAKYRKKKKGYTKEQDIFFGTILAIMVVIAIISFIVKHKTIVLNIIIGLTILGILGVIIYLIKKDNDKTNINRENKKKIYKTPQEIQEEIYQKQKRKQEEEEERKKYENVTFRKVYVEKEEKENKGADENKVTKKEERRKIFEQNRKDETRIQNKKTIYSIK